MKTIQNYLPRMPRRCGACRTGWAMATRKWPNWPDWTRPSPGAATSGPRAARPGSPAAVLHDGAPVLDEAQWRRVLAAMREAGARFDYDDPAPASAPASGDPAPPEAAEEHKFGMLVSGGGAFHEMEQLREFAHFVHEAGVSGLVRLLRQRHRPVPLHAGRRSHDRRSGARSHLRCRAQDHHPLRIRRSHLPGRHPAGVGWLNRAGRGSVARLGPPGRARTIGIAAAPRIDARWPAL